MATVYVGLCYGKERLERCNRLIRKKEYGRLTYLSHLDSRL